MELTSHLPADKQMPIYRQLPSLKKKLGHIHPVVSDTRDKQILTAYLT